MLGRDNDISENIENNNNNTTIQKTTENILNNSMDSYTNLYHDELDTPIRF